MRRRRRSVVDQAIDSVRLPRGYRAPDNTPWIERDGTHLELQLMPDKSVRWRLVDSSTGRDHPGF